MPRGKPMPDYREILQFLAKNPPQLDSERALHASLLELLASCLRSDTEALQPAQSAGEADPDLTARIEQSHATHVIFS